MAAGAPPRLVVLGSGGNSMTGHLSKTSVTGKQQPSLLLASSGSPLARSELCSARFCLCSDQMKYAVVLITLSWAQDVLV